MQLNHPNLVSKKVLHTDGEFHKGKVGCLHPAGAPYHWIILILAANLLLVVYFSDESIPATVPLLKKEYNLNSRQIALMYSASFVPNMITTILGGILIDKYGTNKMSLVYSSLVMFGSVIFALSPSYYGKIAGRAVFGLGFEPLEVTQDAILSKWFFDDSLSSSGHPSLSFSYGFTFATSQLGQLIGTNLLPVLGEYDLFYCFSTVALVCILGVCSNLVLIFLDYRAAQVIRLEVEKDEDGFSFARLKRLPLRYWLLCCITCLSYTLILVFMAFSTDLQHTRYNTPVSTAGHINSMVYGLSILLSPFMGFMMDKFGKVLYVLSFGISMLISGLLITALTDMGPYLGLCFIGVAYSCIPNAIWPCIPSICGEQMSGTAFGGVTGMNSVGLLLFPYLVGSLHDHFQSYTPPCLALASLATIGLCVVIVLIILDKQQGGWINDGKSNPYHLLTEDLDYALNFQKDDSHKLENDYDD